MRVFVTGASGLIGSAVTADLIAAGHEVLGLARSDDAAAAITAAGGTPLPGSLDDLDSLRAGAAETDATVHLGYKHDYSNMEASGHTERAALEAMLAVLEGTGRPFAFASGVAGLTPGRLTTESDVSPHVGPDAMRGGAEQLAFSYVDRDVRSIALRFAPTVHGEGDHGFVARIAGAAASAGVSSYVGDGQSRWPAVGRMDAARLAVLALENAPAGTVVHAVDEEGIATRDIAEAIGAVLGVPTTSITAEEAVERLGFVGRFFGLDTPASSDLTRRRLGWTPTAQGLLADIAAGYYTP